MMTWLSYPGHGWAVLIGTLVCAMVGLGFYRLFRVRRLHAFAVGLAGVLQGLCVVCVLLILCDPSALTETPHYARNRVLVVMDTSESMSIEDTAQGTRLDAAISAFEAHATAGDDTGPQYQIHGLDTSLYGCDQLDQLTRWGAHSRVAPLSRRLSELMADANGPGATEPISGVVLMTDGQFEDAWHWPGDIEWPDDLKVVVVGVGSPNRPSDVSVTRVRVPGRVSRGSLCPIEIAVSCTEDIQGPLMLDVVLDDVSIERVTLDPSSWTFHQGQAQQIVSCEWPMNDSGRHVLGARLATDHGDKVLANNEAWTLMEVVEPQISRVLLYSRRASLQVGKLRRVLASDTHVILDVCLDVIKDRRLARKSSHSSQSVHFPYEPNEFRAYDLIVMVTSDDTQWDATLVGHLYDYVVQGGGGLIVLTDALGQGALNWQQGKLRQLLPVTFSDAVTQAEPALGVHRPSQDSLDKRLFPEASIEDHDLPVLAWNLGRMKPATTALSVVHESTAVCVHRVGQGSVCLIGLSKLFQLYREDQGGGPLFDLVSTLVRLVSPEPGHDSQLRVFVERVPGQSDQLSVTSWVKGADREPVDQADVLVTLGEQVVALTPMGRGRYQAVVPYVGPQSLVVHAEAQAQGEYLGQCVTTARLPGLRTEMSRIPLNESQLLDLSWAMEAEYVHVEDVDPKVFDRFEGRSALNPDVKVTSQWPRWAVLCLLCVLLCAGWSVRRSLGMG
ncbi:MAG: hypothetical protein GY809_09205 [Planctomycetes bacterium]|nr:hypothetical protein [Planctomycetota bacterium]